jgi:hypothetical protein
MMSRFVALLILLLTCCPALAQEQDELEVLGILIDGDTKIAIVGGREFYDFLKVDGEMDGYTVTDITRDGVIFSKEGLNMTVHVLDLMDNKIDSSVLPGEPFIITSHTTANDILELIARGAGYTVEVDPPMTFGNSVEVSGVELEQVLQALLDVHAGNYRITKDGDTMKISP